MREPHPTPATELVDLLVRRYGRGRAKEELDRILDQIPVADLAGLACDWEGFWARPSQIIPSTDWSTYGRLAGRGNGKTVAIAHWVNAEVRAGRAMCIGLAAQNETKTIAVQVESLKATAWPRFVPEFSATTNKLTWPNGAYACVFSPESPENIRSENMHLSWMSEIQSWDATRRDEAMLNFDFATRVGYARQVWDATPKRGHPVLKRFIARAAADPANHILVGGTMYENRRNLSAKAIAKLDAAYAGTNKGREELLGEMLGDEDAIWRQAWFDATRRGLPDRYKRRARYHDPAITSDARHSDSTGIFDMGLGFDGQIYAIKNHSGKHRAEEWATASIVAYEKDDLDLLWVETNRGGDSHAALLRVVARSRGLELRELAKDEVPVRRAGIVNFRGVNTKRQKVVRAEGAATLCEKKRVTMAKGLETFEEKLCAFDGSDGASDDDIDAFVHGCHDLAELSGDKIDPSAGYVGLSEMSAALNGAPRAAPSLSLAALLGGGSGGGRI